MSDNNIKTATARKSSDKVSKAVNEALKAALEQAQMEFVPLSSLVISPLNVRTVPYTAKEVRQTADSIHAIGLLQNLVIHALPEGMNGVAAGGKRLTSLNLLLEEGKMTSDTLIAVKRLPDDLARAASITENSDHKVMHPAEQIVGFRDLAAEGKTEAQIGALFGYSSRHVQRCLKMANLAPSLLKLLAQDEITLDICQALCLEDDQQRQVEVWESAKNTYYSPSASVVKNLIVQSEVSILNNRLFAFVGRETYEAAGGVVREDLFSGENGEGFVDKSLLTTLAEQKLAAAAQTIQTQEGWSWSLSRWNGITTRGDDRTAYCFLDEPEPVYAEGEEAAQGVLIEQRDALETEEDDAVYQEQIDAIEERAISRGWTEEQKASGGVVVSYDNGYQHIQRGVFRLEPVETPVTQDENVVTLVKETPKAVDQAPATLVTALSSERTLAVQAALSQQPHVGLAMLTWKYCLAAFGKMGKASPLKAHMTVEREKLVTASLSGEQGKAFQWLEQEKERVLSTFPEDWTAHFTWLLDWQQADVSMLLGFCVAFGIDGVQARLYGKTEDSALDALESTLNFDLRDWWQPTAAGYFCKISKDQIVDVLNQNGLSGVAVEAAKLKRGEAAVLAEKAIGETRWVPEWMKAPVTDTQTSQSDIPSTDATANAA
ncbi:ParB family chromosome partitioning protein [Rahnella inusitata]|nr:ParB family chromosome partitioning protein [Rahnella inusitata]